MKPILADNADFVEAFVETCFNKGFTEKQAAEMLRNEVYRQLIESGDEHFADGLSKSANARRAVRALRRPFRPPHMPGAGGPPAITPPVPSGPASSAMNPPAVIPPIPGIPNGMPNLTGSDLAKILGGAGLFSAGVLAPNAFRTVPFDTDETVMSGGFKGLMSGIGAGALAMALRKPRRLLAATRRGNPFQRRAGGGWDIDFRNPFRTGLPSHIVKSKGFRNFAAGGGLLGAGMGAKDMLTGSGGFSPYSAIGYNPNYGDPGSSVGGGSGGGGNTSIYGVPRALRDYYAPGSSSARATGGAAAAAGITAGVREAQARLDMIDKRISDKQRIMSTANYNDPKQALAAADAKREMKRLMKERDRESKAMGGLLSSVRNEHGMMQAAARRDLALANNAEAGARQDFDRHLSFLTGDGSGLFSNPWIAPIMAKLFNSRERAGMLSHDLEALSAIRDRANSALSGNI